MRSPGIRFLTLALAAAAALLLAAGTASAQMDISGRWTFTVQSEAGTTTPSVTLVQEGDRLTGTYASELLGSAELSGTVDGSEFRFSFPASVQGTSITVTYRGRIESPTELRGTLDLGGFAGGTFVARPRRDP